MFTFHEKNFVPLLSEAMCSAMCSRGGVLPSICMSCINVRCPWCQDWGCSAMCFHRVAHSPHSGGRWGWGVWWVGGGVGAGRFQALRSRPRVQHQAGQGHCRQAMFGGHPKQDVPMPSIPIPESTTRMPPIADLPNTIPPPHPPSERGGRGIKH